MANALKLVYSHLSFANLQETGQSPKRIFATDYDGYTSSSTKGYNNTDNPFYYSVVFTDDGKIVTHGKVYNTVLGDNIQSILTGVYKPEGSVVTLSVGTGTNAGLVGATLDESGVTAGTYGATENYTIKVPSFTIDAYGRVTAASLPSSALNVNFVTSSEAGYNTSYYLLGRNQSWGVAGTSGAIAHSKLKAGTDASGNLTLTTLKLTVTDGATGITLGSGAYAVTLNSYIEAAVNEAKTQAMSFMGADTLANIVAKTVSTVSNGDTYKVTTGGTLATAKSSDGSEHTVVTGDVLIAVVSGDPATLKWAYVPSGDDDVVIDVQVGGTSLKTSGIVSLGNAAQLTVLNGAIADYTSSTNLVNASQVATYVSGYVSGDTSHIKSFTLDDGLKSDNTTTNKVENGNKVSLNLVSPTAASNTYVNIETAYAVSLDSAKQLIVDLNGTKNVFSSTATGPHATSNKQISSSGTVYLNLISKLSAVLSSLSIAPGSGISTTTNASGQLTIANSGVTAASVSQTVLSSASNAYEIGKISISTAGGTANVTTLYGHDTNTWRPVRAYKFDSGTSGSKSAAEIRATGTGTDALSFGADFVAVDLDTSGSNANLPGSEIHLVWAEISSSGISYHV